MTVDVRVETAIRRPVDEVAAFAADPAHAPTWYRRISSVEVLTGPPLRVGTRAAFRARFLARDLAYTYEVTDFEAGERLVMTTAEGPFPMTTEYTWRPIDGGTRMTLRNHGEPSGVSRPIIPLMRIAMSRAMTGDLARLTRLLERD